MKSCFTVSLCTHELAEVPFKTERWKNKRMSKGFSYNLMGKYMTKCFLARKVLMMITWYWCLDKATLNHYTCTP